MRLYTFAAFAALAIAAAYPHWPAHVPSLQTEVLNATVRIEIEKPAGNGSGTAIDTRHIITNHHVIASAKGEIRVRGWIVEGGRVIPVIYHATVIASDASKDLAILRLDADWVGAIAPIAAVNPAETTQVCKSGAALRKRPQVTCGVFAGIDDATINGVRHAIHSAATAPGDSGGGVWSSVTGRYELVAVTRATPTVAAGFSVMPVTTMGLAIPLDDLRAFVEESLNDRTD